MIPQLTTKTADQLNFPAEIDGLTFIAVAKDAMGYTGDDNGVTRTVTIGTNSRGITKPGTQAINHLFATGGFYCGSGLNADALVHCETRIGGNKFMSVSLLGASPEESWAFLPKLSVAIKEGTASGSDTVMIPGGI